jgi:hypothetical protein
VDKPTPFFLKRNSTRIVLKNRNKIVRTSPKPQAIITTIATTIQATELPKVTRTFLRRKITRNPNGPKKAQTTTIKNYEQFSEGIDDDIASILPALTSAKPRQPPPRPPTTRQLNIESSTHAVQNSQPNQIEDLQPKQHRKPSSFDEILQQQYKIKGIDVSSEENYEEDERLIGVLGSQV